MYRRLLLWSLRFRKWRYLQQALTIAITASIIMLFVSVLGELISVARSSASNGLARINIEPVMYTPDYGGFPETLKKRLQGLDGVKVVNCFQPLGGRVNATKYFILGDEPQGLDAFADLFPVDPAELEAWKKDKVAAIVGEGVAKDLNLQIGKTVDLPTSAGPLQLKIVGVSRGSLQPYRIAAHVEYIQEFTKHPGLCEFRLFAAREDSNRVVHGINEMSKTTPTPMIAYTDTMVVGDMVKKVAFVPALLGLLGIFLLLTTGLTLGNSSAISIRERRIELSTLRVLGYKPRFLIALLLGEAVVIGLFGAVFAIIGTKLALGHGVQLAPGAAASGRILQHVTIGTLGMICGAVIAILVPVLGTLPSAVAAMRAPLSKALRDSA